MHSLPLLSCRGNNEEFLSRTLKYAQRKKWSHLLAAYKTALAKLKLDQPAAAAVTADTLGVDMSHQPQQQQQQQWSEVTANVAPPSAAAAAGAGRGRAGSKGRAAATDDGKISKKRRVTAATSRVTAAAGNDATGGLESNSQKAFDPMDVANNRSISSNAAAQVSLSPRLLREWRRFATDLDAAERASSAAEGGFAFAFVEGALVKALKHGWWLLLDEINLAPPEVLERIASILEAHAPAAAMDSAAAAVAGSADSSTGLLLVERGESVLGRVWGLCWSGFWDSDVTATEFTGGADDRSRHHQHCQSSCGWF